MTEVEVRARLSESHPEKEMILKAFSLTEEQYIERYLSLWRKAGYLPPHVRAKP